MRRAASRLNLTGMAMLFLPLAMVKVLAVMLGFGAPAETVADSGAPPDGLLDPPPALDATLSEADRRALAHIELLEAESYGVNPLLYGASSAQHPTAIGTPGLIYTVQMIMSAESGNIALINNQQYRVGDHLENTPWEIVVISSQDRQVVLLHDESQREAVLSVD